MVGEGDERGAFEVGVSVTADKLLDALRDIRDVTVGWTRPMNQEEKLEAIAQTAAQFTDHSRDEWDEDEAGKQTFSRPVFVWEEPPGYLRESAYKDAFLRLKMNPGKWARIVNCDVSVAYQHANNLRGSALVEREGPFEIAARKLGPESAAVYARYVGAPDVEEL